MNEESLIIKFLEELSTYQSNHYGYYDRTKLVETYDRLPDSIKKYLLPNPKLLQNLWRGCDGLSELRAISFTPNKGVAHIFGVYVIPFQELKSYGGLIDTEKSRKLADRLKCEFEIGDDEGEVIVIRPIWKDNLESRLRQYFVT